MPSPTDEAPPKSPPQPEKTSEPLDDPTFSSDVPAKEKPQSSSSIKSNHLRRRRPNPQFDLPTTAASKIHYEKKAAKSTRESRSKRRGSGVGVVKRERTETPGPIKRRFMPFFRKFWPHLGPKLNDDSDNLLVNNPVYGRAIEEVDPFVFDDTFCVLSKKFNKNYIFRFSASRSLFLFGPLNSFRRLCVFIVTNQLFDLFIIFTILGNCIALAFDNNKLYKPENMTEYEAEDYDLSKSVELTFLAIYTFEMLLKIIAKGFVINKFSYLRNGWNILDFVVVICGFVTEFLDLIKPASTIDLDVLRTFRVLRAVKTISILPGLRMMINALMNSMVQLIEVMALTFFCLCIFALFALEVYMGKLHQVCVLIKGSKTSSRINELELQPIEIDAPDRHYQWKTWVSNNSNWQTRDFPKKEFVPCSNDSGGRSCPVDYVCLPNLNDNPDDGWTSFDTFLSSMLSTFQLITLDFWERLYELVMSTAGPWCMPFFIMVVFLGSFYLLNLMLAVVAMSYEAEAHSWHQKPLSKHQKLTLHRTDSTFSFDDPTRLNLTILTQLRKRTASERETLARTLRNASIGKRKPRRAIRRKLLLKQNASGGGKSLSAGTAGTPDNRSTTGSVCGSIYGALDAPPIIRRNPSPMNKKLHSGVLGERTVSAKPKKPKKVVSVVSLDRDSLVNVPKGSGGILRAASAISSAVSKVQQGGGVRVNALITKTYYNDEEEPAHLHIENERMAQVQEPLSMFISDGMGRRLTSPPDSQGLMISTPSPLQPVAENLEEDASLSPVSESARNHNGILAKAEASSWEEVQSEVIIENNCENMAGEKQTEVVSANEPELEEPSLPPTASGSLVFNLKDEEAPDGGDDINENHPGEYYDEECASGKFSEGASSVMSNDIMDDIDQYSINSIEIKDSNKNHTRPKSSNAIQRGLQALKYNLSPYVNNWVFEAFITTSIVLNTILLATEHHNQPDWLTECLRIGGFVFTSIFAFECAFKILVLQRDYFSQNWNIFDLIIVCASFLDVFIDTALPGSNTIRSFRLLRIFKLAQSWITMKVLLNIIFSTFGALGNLTLVLVIVIYIFAILGMQVVGNKYTPKRFGVHEPDDPDFPRWNFQDFWYAFMMVFRVLCGEWIEPLWDCLTAHKDQGEWKCFIIFLPILIVGNFIVLNLFLALLLNSFNTEELKAQREKEKETSGKTDNLKRVVALLLNRSKRNIKPPEIPAITVAPAPNEICINEPAFLDDIRSGRANHQFRLAAYKVIQQNRINAAERAILRAESSEIERAEVHFQRSPGLSSRRSSFLGGQKSPSTETVAIKERVPGSCFPPACYNLKCFRCTKLRGAKWERWERCRKWSLKIVAHPFFEWGILVLILASSITLCFEDIYLEQNADLKMALFVLNNFFTFLFIIEMFLKWMALGIYEYFTTFWTLLDIFIVMVSVITLGFDIQNRSWNTNESQRNLQGLGALKALRTLRALRPLRAISRWQGMKVVVNALMYAIPSIFNVLLVCLLFWLVFAIMGVQFFKGKFYKCIFDNNGSAVHYKIVRTMDECCARPDTSWINTTPNFDNVFEGYLSLFQVATFEGWIELMRATTDADPSEINKQSVRDQSFGNYAFFVIFIIFGSFFTLNLFIGVIIDNFNMLKKKYEGNLLEVLLTPSQRRYYTAMKKLGRKKPRRVIRRPTNRFFALFYDISMSRRFEIAIFVLIFLNMVMMSFEHHDQRLIFVHILAGCNSFFSTIYALEAMVKILGLRHYYFTVPWNVFDFCLVLFSVIDLFLVDADLKVPFPPTLLRVVRVFRIGRVLRLIKAAKGIRKLLFALIVSLPALFNIGALLALITFIYAILGMALFKDAVTNNAIDDVFSFQTFAKSSLMLFRLMTAAGWNEVLDALLIEEPICGRYRKMICGRPGEPECVSRLQSVFYMVSYIIISFLIVINMYIAIILENFVEANRDEEVGIIEDDLEMFYVRWSRYDPTASQFIVFDQLSEFLASLDPPLDIPKPNLVAIVSFNLPIARGNKIHCLDILHALVKHVLGHVDDSEEFRKIQEQMEHKFRKQFPSRKLLDIVSSTRVWKIQHNAALTIQKAWREYKRRKNPPAEKAKATQTMRSGGGTASHGFGNMMNRMNNFFHHQDMGKRRRSSLQSSTAFLFTSRKTSDKHQGREVSVSPNTTQPRNSYSSQSSSSVVASPLTRVEASSGDRSRRRRLSPSRLSGGSFEVAVNYGTNSARLLSVHSSNINNKSGTPSPVQTTGPFSGTNTNPLTVMTSSPTSPSSSTGNGNNSRRGSVVVQIHQQLCP